MTYSSPSSTNPSLLARLQQDVADQQAWAEFIQRYQRQIQQWCRKRNLQDADAQDVTQTVLLKLTDKLRTFRYDPARSFRGYLKTLTHFAWCDFVASRHRRDAGSGDSAVLKALETAEARDDLVGRLNAEFDQELLQEAMSRVQGRVEPHTWEAFRLTAIEGMSGAAAAEHMRLKVATVFKAKNKVLHLLQAELAQSDES